MKNLISLFTLFILLSNSQNCKAQTFDGPPKVAMPSDKNEVLIDKIIELTDYESYFKNYCINFITKTGKKKKWTAEKNQSVKSKINFTEFKVQKIYNWLANYSTKELNDFIEFYKKDKNKKTKNIIRDNKNITQHLEWYVQRLTEK